MTLKNTRYVSPVDSPFICSWRQFLDYVKGDRRVNDRSWTRPGFQAMALYRFGIWRYSVKNRFIRKLMSLLYNFLHVFVRNVYGIEISETAVIGQRLRIAHQHGITIHSRAVIGDDCLIRQGVSIGRAANHGGGAKNAAPVLGNHVEIGANSVVVGGITIGDDVAIGPCLAVMRNVASGSVVVATPPRVMRQPPQAQPVTSEEI